jgi:hypothetical protein
MSKKLLVLIIFPIIFPAFLVYAQDNPLNDVETEENSADQLLEKPDFWVGLGGDTALYSVFGLAYGGSLTLGYGSGSLIGFKAAFFFNNEYINTLELDLLFRFYLFGQNAYWGPFIQFIGGVSLINYSGDFAIPSNTGIINAGLSFGWRFILVKRFFVEPAVRAGYPYFYGVGVSAGIRF